MGRRGGLTGIVRTKPGQRMGTTSWREDATGFRVVTRDSETRNSETEGRQGGAGPRSEA